MEIKPIKRLLRKTVTTTYDDSGNVIERRVEKEYESENSFPIYQPYPAYPYTSPTVIPNTTPPYPIVNTC